MDGNIRKDEILRQSYGRAPWYDMNGVPVDAYVIGIAGGSASGKVRKGVVDELHRPMLMPVLMRFGQTSVAKAILSQLQHIPTVLILSQVRVSLTMPYAEYPGLTLARHAL